MHPKEYSIWTEDSTKRTIRTWIRLAILAEAIAIRKKLFHKEYVGYGTHRCRFGVNSEMKDLLSEEGHNYSFEEYKAC